MTYAEKNADKSISCVPVFQANLLLVVGRAGTVKVTAVEQVIATVKALDVAVYPPSAPILN